MTTTHTTTTPTEVEDIRPIYRTALGYRLDLRHRLAWKVADLARWLMGEAAALHRRAHDMSRGEVSPTLPLLVDQLEDVARSMGKCPSELVRQMDPSLNGATPNSKWNTLTARSAT